MGMSVVKHVVELKNGWLRSKATENGQERVVKLYNGWKRLEVAVSVLERLVDLVKN